MTTSSIQILVFDLGGVLIDFAGIEALGPLMADRPGVDVARERWVNCRSVSAFEAGVQPDATIFAHRAVEELQLSLTPEQFLDQFVDWVRGPLDGAIELLTELQVSRRRGLQLVALSNTSPVHSERMAHWLRAEDHFDHWCMSYRLGHAKPSAEIFEAVQQLVGPGVDRRQVWFADDSATNVRGARAVGWTADQVSGPKAARAALTARGVLV